MHKYIHTASSSTTTEIAIGSNNTQGIIIGGVSTLSWDAEFTFSQQGVKMYVAGTALTDFPISSATSLASIYDQYRIDRVECRMYFSANASTNSTPSLCLPNVTVIQDHDDSGSVTLGTALAYPGAQTIQLGNQRGTGSHVFSVTPNTDGLVYNGLTSAYVRNKPMFVDCVNNSCPHYGLKMVFDPMYRTPAANVLGYVRYDFKLFVTYQAPI